MHFLVWQLLDRLKKKGDEADCELFNRGLALLLSVDCAWSHTYEPLCCLLELQEELLLNPDDLVYQS